MKNQILTTEFVMATHLPDMDHGKNFELVEVEEFLIVATNNEDHPASLLHVLEESEEAFVSFLPEHDRRDAKITATIPNGSINVKIQITAPDGSKVSHFNFNTRHYLDVLAEIPESRPTFSDEVSWNIHCLRNGFKGLIDGNNPFWFRFAENLNTLIEPVKKFIEQTPDDYAQKTLLGMNKESFAKAFFPPAPPTLQ